CGRDIFRPPDSKWNDFKAEPASLSLCRTHFKRRLGIVGIKHDGQSAALRHNFTQKFNFLASKLGRLVRLPSHVAPGFAILNCDGTALDPTEFAQAGRKSSRPRSKARSTRTKKSNSRKLARLLRGRPHGPRCRGANDKRDELAPPHCRSRGMVAIRTGA